MCDDAAAGSRRWDVVQDKAMTLTEVDDCEECPPGILRCAHSKKERLVLAIEPPGHDPDCFYMLLRKARGTPPYSVLRIKYRGKGPCAQCGKTETFKNIGSKEILFVQTEGSYHQASRIFDRQLRLAQKEGEAKP